MNILISITVCPFIRISGSWNLGVLWCPIGDFILGWSVNKGTDNIAKKNLVPFGPFGTVNPPRSHKFQDPNIFYNNWNWKVFEHIIRKLVRRVKLERI